MLTPEELRLGDTITTAEWRNRYQPAGICFRHYPLPESRAAGGDAGASARVLAGTCQTPCGESLSEAQEWARLGLEMVGD